jgi:hypothetical protein
LKPVYRIIFIIAVMVMFAIPTYVNIATAERAEEVSAETERVIEDDQVVTPAYSFEINATDACYKLPTVTYLDWYIVHGYDPYEPSCVGKEHPDGITASGVKVTVGKTIAMYGVPFGTQVYFDGHLYTVEDRGVGPGVVDVACASVADCFKITGIEKVYLVES